jgi:protein TonB
MATCDYPSDLVHRIAYPTLARPVLRFDPRSAALPAENEERLPVRSNPQGKEVGDIFYLVESRPRNPWALFGSLAFMSVFLLALIAIPLLHTDPLPRMETLTMLYLPAPTAAAAPGVTRLRMPTSKSTYTPASTSVSIHLPMQKMQEAPPSPVGTVGGVAGGVPGGVVGGVPGGVLSQILGSTGSAPVLAKTPGPAVKRVRLAPRVVEANLLHDVAPTYPPEAGRARIEGTVVLLAVIGKDGSVQNVRVETGLPILAQAAIDAVKQWRYRPYLLNGEPVEVDSQIIINFTLSRG